MDGHIAHLHCRYRPTTDTPGAARFAARLQRVVAECLPASLGAALDRALGEDPAVYVLPALRCELRFDAEAGADDAELARAWAEGIAAAVVRAIRGAGSGAGIVCFADRAEQIASFIIDLLRGEGCTAWFHRAFDHLRSHDTQTALVLALTESGGDLLAVLIALHRRGAFERVLASLAPDRLPMLWAQSAGRGFGPSMHTSPTAPGPSVSPSGRKGSASPEPAVGPVGIDASAAPGHDIGPIERDGSGVPARRDNTDAGWLTVSAADEQAGGPSDAAGSTEALRPLFITTLRLVDLLDLWTGERQKAEHVFRQWLADGPESPDWLDAISLTGTVLDALRFLRQRFATREVTDNEQETLNRRLRRWLAENTWLEVDWFLETATPFLLKPDLSAAPPDLPRPAGNFLSTPRQRQLLDALRQALRGQSVQWDEPLDSPANALRLHTLLAARFPQWSNDPLAAPFIERLLREPANGCGLFDLAEPRGVFLPLRDTVPAARSSAPAAAPAASEAGAVHSHCAGVFLLVRALLDLRLPALVASADWAPLPAALLALGLRWAGAAGLAAEGIDPGLGIFANASDSTLPELRDLWSGIETLRHTRFQALLLQTLAAQRLLDPSTMRIFDLPLDRAEALVAGAGECEIWPLSRIIEDPAQKASLIADWQEIWRESTGADPQPLEASGAERETFAAALSALGRGALGIGEADLVIALSAIAVVRAWARWLRQFAGSSTPWLLDNFVRRSGGIRIGESAILVELDRHPLDIVIEMAGYASDIHRVPWLGGRNIIFRKLAM
jgi:hypothetical protein